MTTYANFWAQSLDNESPGDDASYCCFLSTSSFYFSPASCFHSYFSFLFWNFPSRLWSSCFWWDCPTAIVCLLIPNCCVLWWLPKSFLLWWMGRLIQFLWVTLYGPILDTEPKCCQRESGTKRCTFLVKKIVLCLVWMPCLNCYCWSGMKEPPQEAEMREPEMRETAPWSPLLPPSLVFPYKISCSENHDSLLTIRSMLKNQAWEPMPVISALTGSPAWEHMPGIPALTGSQNSLEIKNFRSAWAT